MSDQNVQSMLERFTWRILANHVSPWELEQLKKRIGRWDDWCAEFSKLAREHVRVGAEAAAAGRAETAGNAYIRAASIYHWASFYFVHEQSQFRAALEAAAECYRKAAPLVSPAMELVEIPFEGSKLPGYLRKPLGVERAPVVIFCPGGDSTKEELYDLGQHVVERGMAYLAFDGPGQGLVSTKLKMRPDYEVVLRAVVDYVSARKDIDASRRSGKSRSSSTSERTLPRYRIASRWPAQRSAFACRCCKFMAVRTRHRRPSRLIASKGKSKVAARRWCSTRAYMCATTCRTARGH
jgi:2,6-dihydroxypseudooxynicotine hydrolase